MKLVSTKSGNFIASPYTVDGVEEGVPFEVDDSRGAALMAKYGSIFSVYKPAAKKAAPRPANKMARKVSNK